MYSISQIWKFQLNLEHIKTQIPIHSAKSQSFANCHNVFLPKLQRLSLQSIKRSYNPMPETRRHHTNSVKLTKILWNDLITN